MQIFNAVHFLSGFPSFYTLDPPSKIFSGSAPVYITSSSPPSLFALPSSFTFPSSFHLHSPLFPPSLLCPTFLPCSPLSPSSSPSPPPPLPPSPPPPQILDYTPASDSDYTDLKGALTEAKTLCDHVNDGVRQKENTEHLEWLQSHVVFTNLEEKLVFNSQTNFMGPRKLLHWGKLFKVSRAKRFGLEAKVANVGT